MGTGKLQPRPQSTFRNSFRVLCWRLLDMVAAQDRAAVWTLLIAREIPLGREEWMRGVDRLQGGMEFGAAGAEGRAGDHGSGRREHRAVAAGDQPSCVPPRTGHRRVAQRYCAAVQGVDARDVGRRGPIGRGGRRHGEIEAHGRADANLRKKSRPSGPGARDDPDSVGRQGRRRLFVCWIHFGIVQMSQFSVIPGASVRSLATRGRRPCATAASVTGEDAWP